MLFLGHPALSFAVVLAGLLVATGPGSLASEGLAASPARAVAWAVAGIAAWVLLFWILAGPLTVALLRAPLLARAAATLLLILPLGLCMGVLFPSGVRLALRLGFSALMGIAVLVYLVAALSALVAARREGAT